LIVGLESNLSEPLENSTRDFQDQDCEIQDQDSVSWISRLLWCSSGGNKGDYQNCSVLCCVLKLCTVISTISWAVLTVLCIGFCHTGPISLCLDIFVFMCVCVFCVFLFHTAHLLYYCEHGGVDLTRFKPNPQDLSSFSALTLLVWSFDP